MKIFDFFRRLPMQKRPTAQKLTAPSELTEEGDREAAAGAATAAVERLRLERLPRWAVGIYLFTAFSALLYLLAVLIPAFADFFNQHTSVAVRFLLAHLTNRIPFSFAELLLYYLPLLLIGIGVYAAKYRCETWRMVFVCVGEIMCIVAILLDIFIWGFGMAYHGSTLDKKLDLERRDVSAEELAQTLEILTEKINAECDDVTFRRGNFSVMPYSLSELNDKLLEAYDKVDDDLTFLSSLSSRLKPVIASEAMSYIHITGVYSYFTGEANLNVNFPDYTIPYTAAHELAHQRGIARENEANFIAFLVCIASDDAYIRYSGYLNMYEYVASALYRANPDEYRRLYRTLDSRVASEETAYSAFYAKYRDSKASVVAGAVNDTYLKIQGTAGTKSYGMVVDLAVAYYVGEGGNK